MKYELCYMIPLAVESLQKNQTEDAIGKFVHVLMEISNALSIPRAHQQHWDNQNGPFTAVFASAQSIEEDHDDGNNNNADMNAVEYFKHPFLIALTSTPGGYLLSQSDLACMSAVCLFNMALIYCTKKPKTTYNLQRATSLFERAFDVTATARPCNQESLLLFRAAVCNNLVALYEGFADLDQVRYWGAHFCHIVAKISPASVAEPCFRSFWIKGVLESFPFLAARAA